MVISIMQGGVHENIFDDYYDGGRPYGCGRAEE
jgi:hypothetical protein